MKQRSYRTYDGKSESVRDVQYNPRNIYGFAAVFDNGMLQIWDTRFPQQCVTKWSAHNGLALCVDHDSTGMRVCTGGRDKMLKVWDLNSEVKKPIYSIQTIASVARCKWRPKYDHIASCSLSYDNRVQVWDINKPFIPVLTWEEHSSSVSDICWRKGDELWSCSKDEYFMMHTILSGYEPSTLLPNCAVSIGALGFLAAAVKPPAGMQKIVLSDEFRVPSGQMAFLARNYIAGPNISETCTHNRQICERIGLFDIAAFWEIVNLFFSGPGIQQKDLSAIFLKLKSKPKFIRKTSKSQVESVSILER